MDLDGILQELGQFGRYQVFCLSLLVLPVLMCGISALDYVFLTMDIPHRCRVPECEGVGMVEYMPTWLYHTVPFSTDQQPERCLRYQPVVDNSTNLLPTNCSAQLFQKHVTIRCDQWVFAESTRTIQHDFDLLCPEDDEKRTSLGSYSIFAAFIGLPAAGAIADRFGRKKVFMFGCFILPTLQVLRSFIQDYDAFVRTQFALGFFAGTLYPPAYIICMEWLPMEKRLLGSMALNVFFCLGEVMLGVCMWLLQDWRLLLRYTFLPMYFSLSYFWLLPESVRWLYSKGRFSEVERILTSVAKINKTSARLPTVIQSLRSQEINGELATSVKNKTVHKSQILQLLGSRILMFRILALCVCWTAMLFTLYGLSLDSVNIGGNRYLSFILVTLVELPAYVTTLYLPDMQLVGRRWSAAGSFFLCATACFTFFLLGTEDPVLRYMLLMGGKFLTTLVTTIMYIYTMELFPTELRSFLSSLCSTVGRVGLIFVPLLPLLTVDPMLVFALVSLVGGLFALTCPETLNTKLPDSVEQAENLGLQ